MSIYQNLKKYSFIFKIFAVCSLQKKSKFTFIHNMALYMIGTNATIVTIFGWVLKIVVTNYYIFLVGIKS